VINQGRCGRPDVVRAKQPARAIAQHVAQGTVKSISGSAITITNTNNKDMTITPTSDTVVFNNGFQSVASVKVGDKIQVLGHAERAANSTSPNAALRTITAWALRVDSAGTRMAIGHVTAVNGNTLTLRTPANRAGITVALDGGTGYKALALADGKFSLASSSLAAIKAGSNLVVEGTVSTDGKTLTAKSVVVMPEGRAKATP
jgi:hypothetical protein